MSKLLFDQGTPVPLRSYLTRHTVETAYEKGWSNVKNRELLNLAEADGYDAVITMDQNLRYQQNRAGRRISIVVLRTTSWPRMKNHLDAIVRQIDGLQPGNYVEIPIP